MASPADSRGAWKLAAGAVFYPIHARKEDSGTEVQPWRNVDGSTGRVPV